GENYAHPDTLIVTVKRINLPPVANAGADFEIVSGSAGNLNGSATADPHALALTFNWKIEPDDFDPANPAEVSTGFIVPIVSNDKEYKAILTVTNSDLLSDQDTVLIKVIKSSLKPIANAGANQTVNEGVLVE